MYIYNVDAMSMLTKYSIWTTETMQKKNLVKIL